MDPRLVELLDLDAFPLDADRLIARWRRLAGGVAALSGEFWFWCCLARKHAKQSIIETIMDGLQQSSPYFPELERTMFEFNLSEGWGSRVSRLKGIEYNCRNPLSQLLRAHAIIALEKINVSRHFHADPSCAVSCLAAAEIYFARRDTTQAFAWLDKAEAVWHTAPMQHILTPAARRAIRQQNILMLDHVCDFQHWYMAVVAGSAIDLISYVKLADTWLQQLNILDVSILHNLQQLASLKDSTLMRYE